MDNHASQNRSLSSAQKPPHSKSVSVKPLLGFKHEDGLVTSSHTSHRGNIYLGKLPEVFVCGTNMED